MATITIEAPFSEDLNYIIDDVQTTTDLVKSLNNIAVRVKRNSGKEIKFKPASAPKAEGLQDLLGLIAHRKESGLEISDEIRKNNRKIT